MAPTICILASDDDDDVIVLVSVNFTVATVELV